MTAEKHKTNAVERIRGILAAPMSAGNIRNLLVDTRILLENRGKEKQYRTLKFYCDWVLHSQMSGKTASGLLAEVDDVLARWVNHHTAMPQNFKDTIGYQIGFYGFEEELETFLKTVGVDMAGPGMVVNWRRFEWFYCQNLVSDCLLTYRGKKTLKLIKMGRVELFKVDARPEMNEDGPGQSFPYGIKWTFEGDGDQLFIFTIEFPNPEVSSLLKSDSSQLIVRLPYSSQVVTQNQTLPALH